MRVLPMFPLGTVLLPGMPLPLHVFEPRYQALVEVCMDGEPEFGVVLIERGSEVGGGDTRFDTACVARIVEAHPAGDGRWVIVTVGTDRIRVTRWLPDDPFPRAEVEDWPDGPAAPGWEHHRRRAEAALRRLLALLAEAGTAAPPATVEVPADPAAASFAMAALAPLGPLDRLRLLQAPEPGSRLQRLATMLDDAATVVANGLSGG